MKVETYDLHKNKKNPFVDFFWESSATIPHLSASKNPCELVHRYFWKQLSAEVHKGHKPPPSGNKPTLDSRLLTKGKWFISEERAIGLWLWDGLVDEW